MKSLAWKRFLCIILLQIFAANAFSYAFESSHAKSVIDQSGIPVNKTDSGNCAHDHNDLNPEDSDTEHQHNHCHTQHCQPSALLSVDFHQVISAVHNPPHLKILSFFGNVNYQPPVPPPNA